MMKRIRLVEVLSLGDGIPILDKDQKVIARQTYLSSSSCSGPTTHGLHEAVGPSHSLAENYVVDHEVASAGRPMTTADLQSTRLDVCGVTKSLSSEMEQQDV